MEWTFKWADALTPGADGRVLYYEMLLPRGFVEPKDAEPQVGPLDFYLEAFAELSTCRPSGMELQAIPFTAIVEYSRIYELEDGEEFAYLMRLMDRTFMRLKRGIKGNNASGNGNAKDNDKR